MQVKTTLQAGLNNRFASDAFENNPPVPVRLDGEIVGWSVAYEVSHDGRTAEVTYEIDDPAVAAKIASR